MSGGDFDVSARSVRPCTSLRLLQRSEKNTQSLKEALTHEAEHDERGASRRKLFVKSRKLFRYSPASIARQPSLRENPTKHELSCMHDACAREHKST
jgi:hypothetical protein